VRVIWTLLAGCLSFLSISFLAMAFYLYRVTGRVEFDPIVHTVICGLAALGSVKIKQHPEKIAEYEARIRTLLKR